MQQLLNGWFLKLRSPCLRALRNQLFVFMTMFILPISLPCPTLPYTLLYLTLPTYLKLFTLPKLVSHEYPWCIASSAFSHLFLKRCEVTRPRQSFGQSRYLQRTRLAAKPSTPGRGVASSVSQETFAIRLVPISVGGDSSWAMSRS